MRRYFFLNIAQAAFLGLWSALWITIACVVSIFHIDWPLVLARRCWAPGLIWASGVTVKVEPLPSLDPTRPYFFAMNHQSMLDIAVAFAVIPINLRFIAKRILKDVPFLGWYMARTGMIFVDRGRPTKALRSLEEASRRVRRGASVIAYPEGTRSTDGTILPFKRGVFLVAQKAGVPVVPVAIEGSGIALPRGGFRLRPGIVRVKMGEPIAIDAVSDSSGNGDIRGEVAIDEAGIDALIMRVRAQMIDLHRSIGGRAD